MSYYEDLSRGNGQPIEGAQYTPDVNALEDQFLRDEQLRRGFLSEDPTSIANDPINNHTDAQANAEELRRLENQREEDMNMLHNDRADGVVFERFATPPLSPTKLVYPARGWQDYLVDRMPAQEPRNEDDAKQEAYIAANLHKRNLEIFGDCRERFPHVLKNAAQTYQCIHDARTRAKKMLWSAEELAIIRQHAEAGPHWESAYNALLIKWVFYPKKTREVFNKFTEMRREMGLME